MVLLPMGRIIPLVVILVVPPAVVPVVPPVVIAPVALVILPWFFNLRRADLLWFAFIPGRVHGHRGGLVAFVHFVEVRLPLVGQVVAAGVLAGSAHELGVGEYRAGGVQFSEELSRF